MFRKLFCAAAVVALVACASQTAKTQTAANAPSTTTTPKLARYLPDETTYPVGSIPNAVLHDSVRNKDLSMTIEYPTRGGPYPVIVFSHGFGGSNTGYTPLTEYWAGHGYIVIKPSHADSGKLGPILEQRREERRAEMEKARAEGRGRNRGNTAQTGQQGQTPQPPDPLAEAIWSTQTPADWVNRARDISLILDNLTTLEKKYPELGGRMDTSKIGVSGHSYGAFTAMMLSGMTSFAGNGTIHAPDPRVKAAVVFSPQGTTGTLGLTKDSWKDVTIPMMYVTGSLDYFIAGDAKPRHDAFAYSPAGDKYFVSFNGGRHMTFAGGTFGDIADDEIPVRTSNGGYGGTGTDPWGNPQPQMGTRGAGGRGGSSLYQRDRRIFTAAKIGSTAFFDAYLKGESAAKDYLKPGGTLESFNAGEVTVERK